MIEVIVYGYLTLAFFCLAFFLWESWDFMMETEASWGHIALTYTFYFILWPIALVTFLVMVYDQHRENAEGSTF